MVELLAFCFSVCALKQGLHACGALFGAAYRAFTGLSDLRPFVLLFQL